jgi:hypothetical protein
VRRRKWSSLAAEFELWSLRALKLLATFATESAALRAVCRLIELLGEQAVYGCALSRVTDDGHCEVVALGVELARLAVRRRRQAQRKLRLTSG